MGTSDEAFSSRYPLAQGFGSISNADQGAVERANRFVVGTQSWFDEHGFILLRQRRKLRRAVQADDPEGGAQPARWA
jgi:hypothetical protein